MWLLIICAYLHELYEVYDSRNTTKTHTNALETYYKQNFIKIENLKKKQDFIKNEIFL